MCVHFHTHLYGLFQNTWKSRTVFSVFSLTPTKWCRDIGSFTHDFAVLTEIICPCQLSESKSVICLWLKANSYFMKVRSCYPHLEWEAFNYTKRLRCIPLQQHRFDTWHTGNKHLPPLQPSPANLLCKASASTAFVFMRERRSPSIDSKTWKNTKIHKRNPTARWKITAWAWQINCQIKVLMGNKKEKTAIHHPGTGSNSHASQTPSLSYCATGLWWQLSR